MHLLLRVPIVRFLHQRQLLFPTLVVLAVVAVLAEGWWERSRAADAAPAVPAAAVPATPPRPRLRANLEKAPLAYFSDYWSQLARQAAPSLVPIGSDGVTGILVEPQLAVTSLDAAATVGAGPSHRLLGAELETGLALFEVDDAGRSGAFTLADVRTMTSGAYVAAVLLGPDGEPHVAPGSFVGVRSGAGEGRSTLALNLPLTLESTQAAAIVDLDAALVGIITGATASVVPAGSLPDVVDRLRSGGPCRAIQVADASEAVRAALGIEQGVVVERIHAAAFRAPLRLQAGDILTEWDDEPVESADRFREAYAADQPGRSVRYRFLRGRRRFMGTLAIPGATCRPVLAAPVHLVSLGMTVERAPLARAGDGDIPAWRIVEVDDDGVAARAGIETGDIVTAIDGATLADDRFDTLVTRLEQRTRPVVIALERRGAVTLVAVGPPE